MQTRETLWISADLPPPGLRLERFRPSWTHLDCRHRQLMARHPQIAQRKQCDDLRGVFHQPAIAHLAITVLAVEYAKWMFHLGPDARLHVLEFTDKRAELARGQGATTTGFHGHIPARGATAILLALFYAGIARIAKHLALLSMQKGMGLRDVVRIGRRAGHGMHESRIGINPDMGLYAEVPPVYVHRLVLLWISSPPTYCGCVSCSAAPQST